MEAEDVVYRRALEAIDVGRVSASLLAVYVAAKALTGTAELSIDELLADPLLAQCYEDLRAAIVREQSVLAEQAHVHGTAPYAQHPFHEEHALFDDLYDEEEDRGRRDLTVENMSTSDLLGIDLEVLNVQLVDTDSTAGVVRPRLEQLMPVITMLADAQVRYDLKPSELPVYGLNVLGVLDG